MARIPARILACVCLSAFLLVRVRVRACVCVYVCMCALSVGFLRTCSSQRHCLDNYLFGFEHVLRYAILIFLIVLIVLIVTHTCVSKVW